MRDFASPIRGVRSPLGPSVWAQYREAGLHPELVSDFVRGRYRYGHVPCAFSDLFTFARSGSATYVDSTGTIRTAASGEPRIGHHVWDGSRWVNAGLLIETESRTNLVLNSATPATQDVTVTAQPHTLSFTGTGSVTLSMFGTPLAVLVGDVPNRVSLTFTPSAGTLTLTVSGTVENAQLEVGATPSSHIPTAGATVTRAAEALTIPAANLPYSALAMSIAMEGRMTYADEGATAQVFLVRWLEDANNKIFAYVKSDGPDVGKVLFEQAQAGTSDTVISGEEYTPGVMVPFAIAARHGATVINGAVGGAALTANETPVALPDLSGTDLQLAYDFMGTIRTFRMWGSDLGDAGIEEASA